MSAILHELIWNQETIALFSGMDPRTGQAKNNYQSSHMRIRTTLKVCSILVFLEIDNSDQQIWTVMNKTRKWVENNNGRTFKPPKQRRSTTIWNTSNALCNQNLLLAWHRGCHAVLIGCVSWRTRRPYKCLCLQCRLYPLGERRFIRLMLYGSLKNKCHQGTTEKLGYGIWRHTNLFKPLSIMTSDGGKSRPSSLSTEMQRIPEWNGFALELGVDNFCCITAVGSR